MKVKYNVINNWPKENVQFLDLLPSLMETDIRDKIIYYMLRGITDILYDIPLSSVVVVSPEARGFMLGSIIAHMLSIDFVPIRKINKLPEYVISNKCKTETEYSVTEYILHKDTKIKDKYIIYIDDVLATGGTFKCILSLLNNQDIKGIIPIHLWKVPSFTANDIYPTLFSNLDITNKEDGSYNTNVKINNKFKLFK